MATAAELAQKIADDFTPEKAGDINAVIQIELAGDGGGEFYLNIADGKLETHEGTAENPRMTLKSNVDDFAKILAGEIKPMAAFMNGKIKVTGDMGLAMKLQPLLS